MEHRRGFLQTALTALGGLMGLGVAAKKAEALVPAAKVDGPRLRNCWKLAIEVINPGIEENPYRYEDHLVWVPTKIRDLKNGNYFILDYYDTPVIWKATQNAKRMGNEVAGQLDTRPWGIIATEATEQDIDNCPGLREEMKRRCANPNEWVHQYKTEESNHKLAVLKLPKNYLGDESLYTKMGQAYTKKVIR